MPKETSDAILAIIAIVGIFGNIIAFLVARIELRAQRKETKDAAEQQRKATEDLATLTSDLEHRVHRLATNLDQSIYRFNRVRDLITGLVHTSIALRQKSRKQEDKLELAVKREMTFPELIALVDAIGNDDLKELNQQLIVLLTGSEVWPLMWNEVDYDMGEADKLIQQQAQCTRDMHRLILELLEKTTQIERI